MFLRMEVEEVKVKDETVLFEPQLHYSEPMKITDAFDAEKRTITARMGIFHLFWLVMQDDQKWRLPEEMGNCLNYATFTQEKEELKPGHPSVPSHPA